MNIGKEIKKSRKSISLTQIEFAKRAGVGIRFFRELEQGKPTVRLDKVNQVLEFLGYHLEMVQNTEKYYKQKNKFQYSISFNKELKEKIRKRDNHKCQLCGLSQKSYKAKHNKHLSIHHIDYDKMNCDESNLISLCCSCHSKTSNHRELWMQFFKKLLENSHP
jgi:y4mF family transcriptional regulator